MCNASVTLGAHVDEGGNVMFCIHSAALVEH